MLTGKTVPYETIVERVFRLGIPPQFIDDEEAREVIFDILSLIAAPTMFISQTADIEITDGFGKLPCDFYEIAGGGCRHIPSGIPLVESSNIYHTSARDKVGQASGLDGADVELSGSGLLLQTTSLGSPTYKLQKGYIETGFNSGIVEMSYKAFPTDDRKLPLVPDELRVILCVAYKLAEVIAFRMWMKDQLAEKKYYEISKQADWYMASAQNVTRIPHPDQMEALSNIWLDPLRDSGHHRAGFRRLNNRPRFKTHN